MLLPMPFPSQVSFDAIDRAPLPRTGARFKTPPGNRAAA
jgi:hypothetical protein